MVPSVVSCSDVKLRFSCPSDIDIVKNLCKQWFPIKYPDSWYEDITASNKFYTLIATINEEIIGVLVAEIKPYSKCNYEDVGLLCKGLEKTSRVAYILTLGVVGQWRRHGVATILLNKLTENLTNNPILEDCKAVYLHVLTTNVAATTFYEKYHFKRHKFLPFYYLINTAPCDGYCYVLYINGGEPPPTILGRILGLCCFLFSFGPCKWAKTYISQGSTLWNSASMDYSDIEGGVSVRTNLRRKWNTIPRILRFYILLGSVFLVAFIFAYSYLVAHTAKFDDEHEELKSLINSDQSESQ